MSSACPTSRRAWPLERVLFALAGTVTLLSAALVALASPWFLLLTAFVGVNQWLYVAAGACPASLLLTRRFGLRAAADTSPVS
jgi:hypothetical protein